LATYLIDYENSASFKFFDFADDYRIENYHRLTDFTRERYHKEACRTFWETVKRNDRQQPCVCNQVILFYSKNSPKTNLTEIKEKCTDAFEYLPNGIKNGLDFQLTTYLGSLINGEDGLPTDSRFYIVSGDKGFGSAIHFWEENSNFSNLIFAQLSNKADFGKAFIRDELEKLNIYSLLYRPNSEENIKQAAGRRQGALLKVEEILSMFFREPNKRRLHNGVQHIIGGEELSKNVYYLIRPLFDKYKILEKKLQE
jgi:hypothetical protein